MHDGIWGHNTVQFRFDSENLEFNLAFLESTMDKKFGKSQGIFVFFGISQDSTRTSSSNEGISFVDWSVGFQKLQFQINIELISR
jgi:hypothetical protein